ncbi:hypothetical protein [Streptomyces sp. NPDC056401]|uniref:hypothetical protein n=1 Tax=Streptomyces sp. NPDC056401 TaxID=3345809 RepID=UPI0035DC2437
MPEVEAVREPAQRGRRAQAQAQDPARGSARGAAHPPTAHEAHGHGNKDNYGGKAYQGWGLRVGPESLDVPADVSPAG